MEVEMQEFGEAEAPDSLETCGLATCIGVAIIYGNRGFVMHTPSVIVESDTVTDPFFALLKRRIPASARGDIIPVLAGGCLDRYTGGPEDVEVRASTMDDRTEILRRLADAGFLSPDIRWAMPHEAQSFHLDLEKRIIERRTDDLMDRYSEPEIERFQC